MRNQILWTEDFNKIVKTADTVIIDVSKTVSEHFFDNIDNLLKDPLVTLKSIIYKHITENTTIIVLTNLGILLEPDLHISVAKFLLDFAISRDVILYWPYHIRNGHILAWGDDASAFDIIFDDAILQHLELSA